MILPAVTPAHVGVPGVLRQVGLPVLVPVVVAAFLAPVGMADVPPPRGTDGVVVPADRGEGTQRRVDIIKRHLDKHHPGTGTIESEARLVE